MDTAEMENLLQMRAEIFVFYKNRDCTIRSFLCIHPLAPGIPSAIQAEAVNSSAIRIATWSAVSAGACDIKYQVCICPAASATCTAESLISSYSNTNCLADVTLSVLFNLLLI